MVSALLRHVGQNEYPFLKANRGGKTKRKESGCQFPYDPFSVPRNTVGNARKGVGTFGRGFSPLRFCHCFYSGGPSCCSRSLSPLRGESGGPQAWRPQLSLGKPESG